jgi:hypothetical protein
MEERGLLHQHYCFVVQQQAQMAFCASLRTGGPFLHRGVLGRTGGQGGGLQSANCGRGDFNLICRAEDKSNDSLQEMC